MTVLDTHLLQTQICWQGYSTMQMQALVVITPVLGKTNQ